MCFRLRHGQKDGFVHVFRAPLGDGVKIAHGVQLVAEKLRAQRLFLCGRIDIQNAAAQRELPHALDEARPRIPRARQPLDQLLHAVFRPAPERHGRRKQNLPRHRAQKQRVKARDPHRHAALRQIVEQPQPLLLPLARHADRARKRQLARRQDRRLLAKERTQLRRQPPGRQIILAHGHERPAGMLVQRREHMAARRLTETGDSRGLPRLHRSQQLHVIRAFLQELKQNVHGFLLKTKNQDKQATRIGDVSPMRHVSPESAFRTAFRYIPRPLFRSRFLRCRAPRRPHAPWRTGNPAIHASTRWTAPSRPDHSPGAAWRRRRS